MTNSAQMTVEELITQRLKEDSFYAVIGNEDILNQMVKKAIQETIFKEDEIIRDNFGREIERIPSPIKTASLKLVEAAISEKMDSLIKELLEDEKFNDFIVKLVSKALPSIVIGTLEKEYLKHLNSQTQNFVIDNAENLTNIISTKLKYRGF